jgi:hypothetical protein
MRLSKAITAILLSVLVISIGNGQRIILHWCGDAVSDIAVALGSVSCGMDSEPVCSQHRNEQVPGCCSNTVVEWALDEFSTQPSAEIPSVPVFTALPHLPLELEPLPLAGVVRIRNSDQPPPKWSQPLHLQFRQLLI